MTADDATRGAEELAAAVLAKLAEMLGDDAAAGVWRKVLAQHGRRRPRGQTELVLKLAWAGLKAEPNIGTKRLYHEVSTFLAEKGRGRAVNPDGPDSIARLLQRRFPPYRAKQEARDHALREMMARKLLEPHAGREGATKTGVE